MNVTYAYDDVWHGFWADLRDGDGHLIENGFGRTQDAALADLRRRQP